MIDYNKRLVEVDEILNYLSEDDLLKIPNDVKNTIKQNKDKNYVWKYDETKSLKEQNLNRDTIIILSYINMEYLLNEEQKKLMQQIHDLNDKKLEESKMQKYSVDDLFKNEQEENNQHIEQTEEQPNEPNEEESLVEYKEENIFIKIINKIKNFLKAN